jgi:hypothetical protein
MRYGERAPMLRAAKSPEIDRLVSESSMTSKGQA